MTSPTFSRYEARQSMANRVSYEWVVEQIDADDAYEDIIECSYWPEEMLTQALADAASWRAEGFRADFGLCRIVGNEVEGELDRQYAYLEDGVLPGYFDGGASVPKRFAQARVTIAKTAGRS